ncbi:MAG TPA: YjbH domain-containing protein, partial [Castellaniella sp.]|nr:YjbH domain-containing protein [Castellaniella sp.]
RTAASRANDIDAVLDAIALERAGGTADWSWGLARFGVESHHQTSFGLAPTFSTILNDPSGAFKYDIGLRASANVGLARGLWLNAAVQASVLENVTDVTQASNSTLPHVRSDLAEYRRAARVKLDRLLLNQFWQPAERVYARASAGIYEEMFAGAGGQVLYLAPGGRWAFDAAVDVLRQRDYKGTGFMNYNTHTVIGSAHYRLPWIEGATVSVRAGRFLAGDVGARLEVKRTFKSGIEFGLWYTRTNGKDETSPGAPGDPYFDKGLFVRIPLGPLLTRDTGATTFFSLAPWNRDVGQMVASPADLYGMAERGWLNNALDGDGLRGFGDIPTEDGP